MRRRLFHSDTEFVYPALLELYAHDILLPVFTDIAYEPEIPGTSHRPEFIASRPNGISVAVECKVVFDEKPVARSDRELRRLVNRLKKFDSRYGLSVQPQGGSKPS